MRMGELWGKGEKRKRGGERRRKAFLCSIQDMIFLFPSIVGNNSLQAFSYKMLIDSFILSLFNLTFQAPTFCEFLQVLKLLVDMETILLLKNGLLCPLLDYIFLISGWYLTLATQRKCTLAPRKCSQSWVPTVLIAHQV